MKYIETDVETRKDTIRKNLTNISLEKAYTQLAEANPTMESLFYKVNDAIKDQIISDSKREVISTYIGELLYYKVDYYEQLLVNLGMEFKLRAYHLNKSDYNIKSPELNDSAISLINEFTERVKFVLSRPLLDIYYNLQNEESIGEDYSNSNKLMSLIKNFISELLKMIYYNIRGMVRSENLDRPNKDALSIIYYGYYLEYQDFCITQILDNLFSCIRAYDEPWTDDDVTVHEFLNRLGFSLVSPKSDPLKAFYG